MGIEVVIIFGVIGTIVAVAAMRSASRELAREQLAQDNDVEPVTGGGFGVTRTKKHPVVAIGPDPESAASVAPRWAAQARVPTLSARTTMTIKRTADRADRADRAHDRADGADDLIVDERTFFETHAYFGSHVDVVRGVLAQPDVSLAIRALFVDAIDLTVREDGTVRARMPWTLGSSAVDAKRFLMRMQDVVIALEAHAHAQALPPQANALGGATGAPVGIPSGGA